MQRKRLTRTIALRPCRRRVSDNSARYLQPRAWTDSRAFRTATSRCPAQQAKRVTISSPFKTQLKTLTQHKTLVLVGGLRWGFCLFARGHGDDDVFALFAVRFWHAQDQLVLADAELRGFSDGQQHRMLFVFRTDAINHALRLKNVFLAEHFLRLLVLAIRAENFAGNGFGALLLRAARAGIHAEQSALLIVVFPC